MDFSLGLFQFTITPVEPLDVPAVNKGNMLRGGFGHAFRRLCCVPQCKDAKTCPLGASCPYKAVFEPSPPAGSNRLSRNQDIPRPFVFRAPPTRKTRFEAGERFEFGLVLMGRALDSLPYFVLSFRELAQGGLGLNRARCTLEKVEEVGVPSEGDAFDGPKKRLIYSAEDQLFRAAHGFNPDQWIKMRIRQLSATAGTDTSLAAKLSNRHGNTPASNLTIRFLTPTFLRADGEVVRRPEFHHIFKRLRDRINALSTFFGDGPVDADFRGLGERAEKVRTVAARAEWVERFRTSSKTHQRHELSGFVGETTYEGEIGEFLPWLNLGELVHVGKHSAWGNGWFEVVKPRP